MLAALTATPNDLHHTSIHMNIKFIHCASLTSPFIPAQTYSTPIECLTRSTLDGDDVHPMWQYFLGILMGRQQMNPGNFKYYRALPVHDFTAALPLCRLQSHFTVACVCPNYSEIKW